MNPQQDNYLVKRVDELLSTLTRWRGQKSEEQYPVKVCINIWMEMRASQMSYLMLQDSVWQEGHRYMNKISEQDQIRTIEYINGIQDKYANDAMIYFKSDLEITENIVDIDMDWFNSTMASAQNGSNQAVEDLEFVYILMKVGLDYFNLWLIVTVAGDDPHHSFSALTGKFMPVMPNDFTNLFRIFRNIENIKYGNKSRLENAYKPLPPLWK